MLSSQTEVSHLLSHPHLSTHCVSRSKKQIDESPLHVQLELVGTSEQMQFDSHPQFAGIEQVAKLTGHIFVSSHLHSFPGRQTICSLQVQSVPAKSHGVSHFIGTVGGLNRVVV